MSTGIPGSVPRGPMRPSETPSFLLVNEVAVLLRTSVKAIYAMIERGSLPGVVRIGRRVLVRSDILLDWLRQKSAPSLER
ncbi:MAG: helix-turn-helix domain-containing protein [Vicinamibacterales bacterium]